MKARRGKFRMGWFGLIFLVMMLMFGCGGGDDDYGGGGGGGTHLLPFPELFQAQR